MPRTRKREKRPTERLAPGPDEILDHFAPDWPMTALEIDAAGRRLKKALMERTLGGERAITWDIHRAEQAGGRTNHRNGTSEKRVLTDDGPMAVEIPRIGTGRLPQLIPKSPPPRGLRRQVLALYASARPRDQKFLAEIYAIDVSPDLMSRSPTPLSPR